MNRIDIKIGQKVTYIPIVGDPEIGIVKAFAVNPESVFVVYKCNNDWKDYKNYTGANTHIKDLYPNWITETLTLEQFKNLPDGEIFSTGLLPNSPEGIFMTNSGGELRWVAVKGYGNDWTVYTHWSYNSIEWIKSHGDKIHTEEYIRRCVYCTDEVFALWRK